MAAHLTIEEKNVYGSPHIGGEKLHGIEDSLKGSPETALRRWAGGGVLFTVLLTSFMSFLNWQSTRQGEEDTDWVVHTLAVQRALQAALGQAVDAQTRARGFAVTGQEAFLEPGPDQERALAQDMDALRDLTADNPVQQARLSTLRSQVNASMQTVKEIEDERQRTGQISSGAEFLDDKRRMDAVRATVAAMQGDEARLLSLRMGKTQEARRMTRIVVWSSALMGVALLVLTGLILLHEINRCARMQAQLRTLNAGLEVRVAERTEQLQSTVVELRHKNEEVEAFVYIVSHDLRAPLVNVMGFARELESSCARLKTLIEPCELPAEISAAVYEILDADMPGAVHFISQSSLKFERLIDALLSLSRHGRQIYRPVYLETEDVVANAVATFQRAIAEGGAEVELGRLPPVTADMTALGQVFSNLIGNSLKYRSPQRPLKVEVGGQSEDGLVHFWVRDNGLGIPESGKTRLFQVFQRLHPQHAQGEGMGLAIAHRIVERHGGRIWAESREGEGTTFHFSLPGNAGANPNVIQGAIDHGSNANGIYDPSCG